jgi:stearoyl-CoA desaturase (delta-9 desaturase)
MHPMEAGTAEAPPETTSPAPTPTVADAIPPVEHETTDRIITGLLTFVPFALLFVAAWQTWNQALRPSDLIVFGIVYFLTGFGITIGFHRLLTHRSFKTYPWLRGVFAALGSAAIEGPVISWVADHRKHHACSDREGDPHSPHVGHGSGWKGALKGFFHAHLGWIFIHTERGNKQRFAPDLIEDPVVSYVNRTFFLWAVLGFVVAFGLGYAIGGDLAAGLTGLLWGGAVRVFLLHHVTYSINSLCHIFGRQPFKTKDESRNLAWLAVPTMGESWHNNHHAFPTSAVHGLGRWQFDLSAIVIAGLEKSGLIWDVVRIPPERQAAKALT